METQAVDVLIYKPLVTSRHEFRILRLLSRRHALESSATDATIVCTLDYVSLKDSVSYEALSYAWDAPSGTSNITLCGRAWSISANLAHALRYLQHDDADRLLWADQLCINQKDEVEKADQIKKMTRIYAQAHRVLAWIGPSTALTDLAMCTLYHVGRRNFVKSAATSAIGIARDPNARDTTRFSPSVTNSTTRPSEHGSEGTSVNGGSSIVSSIMQNLNSGGSASERALWTRTEVYKKLSEALDDFSTRSYWTRLWVLQEFAVGKRMTVMCGARTLSIDLLEEAWDVLRFSFDTRHEKANEYQARSWAPAVREFVQLWKTTGSSWDNWLAVKRLLSQRHEVQMTRARVATMRDQAHDTKRRWHNSQKRDNCLFLIMYRNLTTFSGQFRLQCADPRDRCFALLGLATDKRNFESLVDYSKPMAEVFRELAQRFLVQGHVNILSLCQEGYDRTSKQLPSWAPNWTHKIRIPAWGKVALNAFPSRDSVSIRTPDANTIILNGICIDRINTCGQLFSKDGTLTLQQTKAYLSDLERFCRESDRIPNEHIKDVCAQIASPTSKAFISDQDRIREQYLELEERVTAADDHEVDSDSVNGAASLYEEELRLQLFRCPFITDDGYVGIAQPFIREDDLVCAFPGGSTPFVLRPLPDGEAFELVSAAYVNGMMTGECTRAEFQRRDFVLK